MINQFSKVCLTVGRFISRVGEASDYINYKYFMSEEEIGELSHDDHYQIDIYGQESFDELTSPYYDTREKVMDFLTDKGIIRHATDDFIPF